MLRHVVLFPWKPEATAELVADFTDQVANMAQDEAIRCVIDHSD